MFEAQTPDTSNLPSWATVVLAIAAALVVMVSNAEKILSGLRRMLSMLRPTARAELLERRRLLAESLALHVSQNSPQGWSDKNFTELEAQVQIELSPRFWHRRNAEPDTKLVDSLTSGLIHCNARIIYLEGRPGAGKSVALRHLANAWAQKAGSSLRYPIPLYLNLRRLDRKGMEIDRTLIERFVRAEIRTINHPDVEEFLAKDFHQWCRDGHLLFLFDSFDELKDVLGSTESDEVIGKYIKALEAFAKVQSKCRMIVASRSFRGPRRAGWAHFYLQPLSTARRVDFIENHIRNRDLARETIETIERASSKDEIRKLAENPLMLSLLCNHVAAGHPIPTSTHLLFQNVIERRLRDDQHRLRHRFGLDWPQAYLAAEEVALTMSMEGEFGLDLTRIQLLRALRLQPNRCSDFRVEELHVDALEAVNVLVMRAETEGGETEPVVSFSVHRRFQEFFTASAVLKTGVFVSIKDLLTDYRWRESCVVIIQHGEESRRTEVVKAAQEAIRAMKQAALPNESVDMFRWPKKALHVLEMLQAGYSYRNDVPPELREDVEWFLVQALEHGTILEQKWGLEIAGLLSEEALHVAVELSVLSRSSLLRDAAFIHIDKLPALTPRLFDAVLKMLGEMADDGRLRDERFGMDAKLSRIQGAQRLRLVARFLRLIPRIDLALQAGYVIALVSFIFLTPGLFVSNYYPLIAVLVLHGLSLLLWQSKSDKKHVTISMLRVMAVFGLALLADATTFGSEARPPNWFFIAGGTITIYLATWPIVAVETGRRALFVETYQWFVSHVIVFAPWKWSRHARWMAASIGCSMLVMMPLLVYYGESPILESVMIPFAIAAGLFVLGVLLRTIVNNFRDRFRWRQGIEAASKTSDFFEVISWIAKFGDADFRVRALQVLRKRKVFGRHLTNISQDIAYALLAGVEFDRRCTLEEGKAHRASLKYAQVTAPDRVDWASAWYYQNIPSGEIRSCPDLADELARCLEPWIQADERNHPPVL